jgi:hypothetical protein
MNKEMLYDNVIDLINRNESIYDNWEFPIAAFMAKRWPAALKLAQETAGEEEEELMSTTLIADMGRDAINDPSAFLSDLKEVIKTLSKGCQLNSSGEWC